MFNTEGASSGYNNEEDHIWHKVFNWLREINLAYSLEKYLHAESKQITEIRQSIFQKKNIRMKSNSNKLLNLLSKVESNFIILERVLMEFDLIEKHIQKQLEKYAKPYTIKHNNWSLSEQFSTSLTRYRETLAKHTEFLQSTTNQIFNIVNLRSTRTLSIYSIFISTVSLLIAITSSQIDWKFLESLIQQLFK